LDPFLLHKKIQLKIKKVFSTLLSLKEKEEDF